LFDFEKFAPNVGRITRRPFFVWKEILTQRVARKLFGQVWGNSGKNISHPRNLPASTPMVQSSQWRGGGISEKEAQGYCLLILS